MEGLIDLGIGDGITPENSNFGESGSKNSSERIPQLGDNRKLERRPSPLLIPSQRQELKYTPPDYNNHGPLWRPEKLIKEKAELSDIALRHIFDGVRTTKKIKGYHHRFQGRDWPSALFRVDSDLISNKDPNGVYKASVIGVNIFGETRTKRSEFFPDEWTRDEVITAIKSVFRERKQDPEDPLKWFGQYRRIIIIGIIDNKARKNALEASLEDVLTAWPMYQPKKKFYR